MKMFVKSVGMVAALALCCAVVFQATRAEEPKAPPSPVGDRLSSCWRGAGPWLLERWS